MTRPEEFSPEFVARHSPREDELYTAFWRSGEPFKSMLDANPWLAPPEGKAGFDPDADRYWNTTTGSKHPAWRDQDLPQPTKDIRKLRADLEAWGLCLIEDGLSPDQCARFITRLREQAAGERLAGVTQPTPTGQYVNTLINKGACFRGCIEQDPDHVQAGPVIEQLLNETLGKGWICHSFLANGADPGGLPQGLHIDQGPLLPLQTRQAPSLVNTMFIPQAVDERNGGTLHIPGSHKTMIAAAETGQVGKLPPAINLEAPAGTIMVFDGRLLHGTGINRTDEQRFVATMSCVKPWMRQQENWVVSTRPEIIEQASPRLLHRLGMQALTYGATVEGVGLGATGRVGEAWGRIRDFRVAMDANAYIRVGELSPDSDAATLDADYTVRRVRAQAKAES